MRVLMLGWDFSPRLSGGVGSACQGLANALARAQEPLAAEVLFVLPRLRGDEEPENVRLLAGEVREPARVALESAARNADRRGVSRTSSSASSAVAESSQPPAPEAPLPEPPLPLPSESLRLLALDSPLTPYLSPQDYAAVVRALLQRIRAAAPVNAPRPVSRSTPSAVARSRSAPAPRTEEPAPLAPRVPPYGRTLVAEVERYARAALAAVQHESFDVIHAHDWMTFPAALLLKERTGKPLVLHFHSCEAERRGPLGSADVRAIEQAALDEAERVLCVSERSARTLRAQYAFELAKLRVVHDAYSPLEASAAAEKSGAPVVLFLGRLARQKGPDVFLRAAARVHEHAPKVRFVVAGSGELYPEIRALASELGLARAVQFTGFVSGPELAEAYAGADVYVMPSVSEPFGISALEALSLGVPTIVSREAGVTEVVRSVLKFEPGDAQGLADKIVSLLERPALRRQLVAAGLSEVRKLRWDRPARALRGIYGEVVVGTS